MIGGFLVVLAFFGWLVTASRWLREEAGWESGPGGFIMSILVPVFCPIVLVVLGDAIRRDILGRRE